MKRALSVAKYMALETTRPVIGFYVVTVAIYFVLFPLLSIGGGHVSSVGVDGASMIFLFVMGLNLFKHHFLFSQANGVTRRHFFLGGIMALAAISLALTAMDYLLNALVLIIDNKMLNLSSMVYPDSSWLSRFVWTFFVQLTCVVGGWFITMVFYRSGKALKLVLSVGVPVLLFVIVPIINSATDGWIINTYSIIMWFVLQNTFDLNAWAGSLFMLVVSGVISGFCYLLVRRAPVKSLS